MLKFIGSGDGSNNALGNNSAYIKEKDYLFLIDCGETVFDGILKLNLLKNVKQVYALITHTHCDHVGSLHNLVEHNSISNISTTVIYPNSDVRSILDESKVSKDIYSYSTPQEFKLFGIKEHITVHHPSIDSFGYILTKNNQKIYYSGDTRIIPHNFLRDLLKGDIDIAYIDTCSLSEDECKDFHYPHLSIETLMSEIPTNHRNKVWCMHLDYKFDVQNAQKLGFNVVENEFQKRDRERNVFEF